MIVEVMIVLIGAALLVALGFLVAFLWAVRHGQYDDLYTPSVRILHDDTEPTGHDDGANQQSPEGT